MEDDGFFLERRDRVYYTGPDGVPSRIGPRLLRSLAQEFPLEVESPVSLNKKKRRNSVSS